MKKLYEIEHPYYCEIGNYFSNDCHTEHKSFKEFMSAMGYDSEEDYPDEDYNFLIRWDWNQEEKENTGLMTLHYLFQRKARLVSHSFPVCKDDEPKIFKFLKERSEYMVRVWEPLIAMKEVSE